MAKRLDGCKNYPMFRWVLKFKIDLSSSKKVKILEVLSGNCLAWVFRGGVVLVGARMRIVELEGPFGNETCSFQTRLERRSQRCSRFLKAQTTLVTHRNDTKRLLHERCWLNSNAAVLSVPCKKATKEASDYCSLVATQTTDLIGRVGVWRHYFFDK